MTPRDQILALCDLGKTPAQIGAALPDITLGYVYQVLRDHRPDRPRAPRTRSSKKRGQIQGLLANGIAAPRVAFLADVSAAYVYRIMGEE